MHEKHEKMPSHIKYKNIVKGQCNGNCTMRFDGETEWHIVECEEKKNVMDIIYNYRRNTINASRAKSRGKKASFSSTPGISCKTNRFNMCTRSQSSSPHVSRGIARRTIPSRHRKIDKSSPSPACFSYVSIHTTCQPIVNHYCTFFAFMIYFILYFF